MEAFALMGVYDDEVLRIRLNCGTCAKVMRCESLGRLGNIDDMGRQ